MKYVIMKGNTVLCAKNQEVPFEHWSGDFRYVKDLNNISPILYKGILKATFKSLLLTDCKVVSLDDYNFKMNLHKAVRDRVIPNYHDCYLEPES